jgi:hypothetical protein
MINHSVTGVVTHGRADGTRSEASDDSTEVSGGFPGLAAHVSTIPTDMREYVIYPSCGGPGEDPGP